MSCQVHAQEPVTGTCSRCGNFVCRLDVGPSPPDGAVRCKACAEKATNHLEELKSKR